MRMVSEFKSFILRGNVVDLAVAVVIGAAFGGIVTSLVNDIFMPIIGLITGGFDVSGITIGYKDAQLRVGHFFQTIINFVVIGFCLFLVVKGATVMKKKEQDKPADPITPTEKLLAEIRDAIKAGK